MANILSSTSKGSSTFVSSANSNESFTPSDVVPITGLRKIDSASFLLEWDIRKRGSDVTGYEVRKLIFLTLSQNFSGLGLTKKCCFKLELVTEFFSDLSQP